MDAYLDAIDWTRHGPWLVVLYLLVVGLGLPYALFDLLDRLAARGISVDHVALATRFGGFMNSWAVFGRGAKEYRDLRPLFPDAEAAELARYDDDTACFVARFPDAATAQRAATEHFGSFAAAGIEFAEAGLSFETERDAGRGQWLLVGDTLLAFYGPDSERLAARRRQMPALRERGLLLPLLALSGRQAFTLFALVWVALQVAAVSDALQRAAELPPGAAQAIPLDALRDRFAALDRTGGSVRVLRQEAGGVLIVERRYDDPRWHDFARLQNGPFAARVVLRFDAPSRRVESRVLIGRAAEPDLASIPPAPPRRWHNLTGWSGRFDPLAEDVARVTQAAGWRWAPRLWPSLGG